METISKFRQRDALTQRLPRTLKQADSDGMDWWTTAESDIAKEEALRSGFAKSSKPRPYRHSFFTRLAQWLREQFN